MSDEVGGDEACTACDHDVLDIGIGFESCRACEDWLWFHEYSAAEGSVWGLTDGILPFHAHHIFVLNTDLSNYDSVSLYFSKLMPLCVAEVEVDPSTHH